MEQKIVPFLCGGTLYNLLLLASRKHIKTDSGDSIQVRDRDVMAGLIEAITGEPCSLYDNTFRKCVSEYKRCIRSSVSYLPFDDEENAKAYDNVVMHSYDQATGRMAGFIHRYIDPARKVTLVKSIIELVRDDNTIVQPQHFYVDGSVLPITKEQMSVMTAISLPEFLVGIMHFVLLKRRNQNDRGLATLEAWGVKSTGWARNYSTHSFGQSIKWDVTVAIPSVVPPVKDEPPAPVITTTASDPFLTYLEKSVVDLSTVKTTIKSDTEPKFSDIFVCTDLSPSANLVATTRISDATIQKIEGVANHVVIIGLGGAGKSMMLRHLFFDAAGNYKVTRKLPIFLELKRFNPEESFEDFICRSMRAYDKTIQPEHISTLLSEGKCCVICDAIDELPEGAFIKYQVAVDLFTKQHPDITMVMTSRPTRNALSFAHFSVWRSLGLTKQQALELIRKVTYYDTDDRDVFLKALDDHLYEQHREYASNPLLLTIMLATYKRYRDVPTQLHLFFERAYNTLLSEHDFLKTGFRRRFYTSIDSMYYAQYFSEFCARSYDAKMLDFTAQQFCELMEPVIRRQRLTNGALPIDFLYDAVVSICIMYQEGYEYHFIHRSFQEYFTAKFYADRIATQPELVCSYFEHYEARWEGEATFEMLYGMKPQEMELLVMLPYHERLWEKCGDAKDKESYWRFLSMMYPVISIDTRPEDGYTTFKAKSYLYDFFSRIKGCSHVDELKDMNWPLDIVMCCGGTLLLSAEEQECDEDGNTISVEKTIPYDTFENGDLNLENEDAIIGYRFTIRTEELRRDTRANPHLRKILESPDCPLLKEYREMRNLTDQLREAQDSIRSSNDWFSRFST